MPFDAIISGLEYPMIVATVTADGERAGCLVGFSTQCSIDPARYAVFISKQNHTFRVATRAEMLVVHILRRGDKQLARIFGEETGDAVSKFEQCSWHAGPGGAPVLDSCDWFAGRILERVDAGDHVLHILDITDEGRATRTDQGVLGFQDVRDLEAGHHP